MNEEIHLDILRNAFKYAKSFLVSLCQYPNQYKLLHTRALQNTKLSKTGILATATCLF